MYGRHLLIPVRGSGHESTSVTNLRARESLYCRSDSDCLISIILNSGGTAPNGLSFPSEEEISSMCLGSDSTLDSSRLPLS